MFGDDKSQFALLSHGGLRDVEPDDIFHAGLWSMWSIC